jgi:hypothetical protein
MQRFMVYGFWCSFVLLCLLGSNQAGFAQSTGSIQGLVRDVSGAVVPHARVQVNKIETGLVRESETDGAGVYVVPSLPPGRYVVTVSATGMAQVREENVDVTVGRNFPLNFDLKVSSAQQTVNVNAALQVALETTSQTQSQTLDQRTVQDLPLNGRHFIDLFPTVAGSPTPPQNGSLTAPTRGTGASGFNSAGYREDMSNLMINGITHTDLQQNQIAFQPTINIVSEMQVMNSTPSAEFGRSSGTIVNVATRAGTNAFHGEAYEFVRNTVFDARNFFNPVSVAASPFKRNQFGGDFGGPIWRNHTFFFVTYEGLRQRQGVTINSGVLTAAQRTSTDPAVMMLIPLIPQANNATGTAFIGSASAPVNINQWSTNISHSFNAADSISGFYVFQTDKRNEPVLQGDTVPGFGDQRYFRRQFISLNETHIFNTQIVNEVRSGISRLRPDYLPYFQANPASYGINNGINLPVGLPQITISSIALTIGGPSAYPQYRGDTTAVLSDTLSILKGRNYIRVGGEYRKFISSNNTGNTGSFTFASPTTFLEDEANAFKVTPQESISSRIFVNAINTYVQDNFKASPKLTLEGGVRFEWNGTPTEGANRFVTFNTTTGSLQRVGSAGYSQLYPQNYFAEPRVGFVWDPFGKGKIILRGGYAFQAEQPITNPLITLSANPPFATPLNFTSSTSTPYVTFENAFTVAAASKLAPSTTPQTFKDAYMQNYNFNVQYALSDTIGAQIGYYGNTGTHLRLTRNINQPISGVEPFTAVSASSPIAAGRSLGNITDYDSDGISNYNALWLIVTKQMGHGLQLNGSYTFSKSLDYNSLSTQGVILQDSYNPANNYGPSDFDVRNRFVFSGIYALPIHGNFLISGWQLTGILQLQGGNPLSVFTNLATNGTAGTIRADESGPVSKERVFLANGSVQYLPQSICYTATAGCTFSNPVAADGTQGRNSIYGPGFEDTDLSLGKFFALYREARLEFRADAFNLLNHPNLGQPVSQFTVTAPSGSTPGSVTPGTFGQITNTRFPLGDSGSSRQLQLSLKLLF